MLAKAWQRQHESIEFKTQETLHKKNVVQYIKEPVSNNELRPCLVPLYFLALSFIS